MPEARARRQSRPASYRVGDEYSFLDEDGGTQTPSAREQLDDDEDSDDFMPDVEEPEPDDDFDEDVVEDEDEDEDADDADGVSERDGSHRRASSIIDVDDLVPTTPNGKRTKKGAKSELPRVQRIAPQDQVKTPVSVVKGNGVLPRPMGTDRASLHARGVAEFSKIGGQELRLKDLFGPTDKDLRPILMTRDHWDVQETLPYRDKGGLKGGLRRSFFESEEAREKDVLTLRKWYASNGRDAFARGQKSRTLNAQEAKSYTMNDGPASLNVLMGTINAPQLHAMKKGTYISTAQPYMDQKSRRGWVLNLGSRVQEAQWASSEEGRTQYLAVAVEQKQTEGRQPKPYENLKAPAFSATPAFPASIQIWSFGANRIGELDPSEQPQLELVICTDWGAPKQFRWSPTSTVEKPGYSEDSDEVHLGLLAGIWSDGRVRILDVSYSKLDATSTETQYVHYSQAAFDVDFPQTVPSCIHWLSSTSLAVATAAGTLAIWTLNRAETFPPAGSTTYVPKPWFFKQIADTYILTLASGRPSRPNYISITTADGFARLYDLRSPTADTVPSIRGRGLCTAQAWHEQTQSFTMSDELIMLKHNSLRRFYHNLYTMRAESTISCVATSPVHPGVLVGTADGTVASGNPLARILNYKEMPWQQNWFAHEWRGPVDRLVVDAPRDPELLDGGPVQQSVATRADGDVGVDVVSSDPVANVSETPQTAVSQSVLNEPLVRITAGFKANQPGMQDSITSKRKPTDLEWGRYITVFEEQSAVTTLSWNPNLKFGTWAVAGMGSGLLRVEDIGV
ncbi:hypothetical protein P153DRAFT_308429 [Dothidotthia symphoricarpi CBS 119687]|uniref:WD40 repeat-like protein n=1 Tax=Dothidotthia symphoricarpi CBS 119687 TaxID=1392245 RepID=A0A6A6AQR4_9PLEO|nr:uncharacterized protein P153DRAFT_308429 [Dothidotthia symphoricarpi CBS 119687]KAF2133508.1 hypothetical protein P153DRAFT_308429 [Dothidotthia symphoricarpi CBS 119687]